MPLGWLPIVAPDVAGWALPLRSMAQGESVPDGAQAFGYGAVVDPRATPVARDEPGLRSNFRWWLVVAALLPIPVEKSQAQTSSALSSIDMILTRAGSARALNIAASSRADSSGTAALGAQHADSTVKGLVVPGAVLVAMTAAYLPDGANFEEIRRNTSTDIEVLL